MIIEFDKEEASIEVGWTELEGVLEEDDSLPEVSVVFVRDSLAVGIDPQLPEDVGDKNQIVVRRPLLRVVMILHQRLAPLEMGLWKIMWKGGDFFTALFLEGISAKTGRFKICVFTSVPRNGASAIKKRLKLPKEMAMILIFVDFLQFWGKRDRAKRCN